MWDDGLPCPSGRQTSEAIDSDHDCSSHGGGGVGGVFQTIKEMDFDRGPWTAAANGDLEAITKYLDKGGEPNVCDSSGYTPLHYSSRNGHEQISLMLLKKGAWVNTATKAGKATALHRAAMNNSARVVALLLRYNADPCVQDADGKTPLHKAVESKNAEICRMLIQSNPDCVNVPDKNGKEPKCYIGGTLEDSEIYKAVKWTTS